MGKKINSVEERHELREIESWMRETMEFMGTLEEVDRWEPKTDTNMRVQSFNSFSKAKLQRMLEHLDTITVTSVNELRAGVIDEGEYLIQMFIHTSMLESIKDTCKNWGWTISKNWTIK